MKLVKILFEKFGKLPEAVSFAEHKEIAVLSLPLTPVEIAAQGWDPEAMAVLSGSMIPLQEDKSL
jgi:hypothetical protein